MKKALLRFALAWLVINCTLLTSKAQYITITDTNFLNKLIALGYSPCLNGNLLDTTCNKVLTDTVLNVSNNSSTPDSLKIHDLTAVQYFKALSILNCSYNLNTSLPPLPATLKQLYCEQDSLTALPTLPNALLCLYCDNNHLTALPILPNSLKLIIYFELFELNIDTLENDK